MNFTAIGVVTVLSILAGTLGMLEVGRRIGVRQMARDPEGAKAGSGAIDGAVFGLLGLLIAFTFSGAAQRFDVRRAMIVEEANSIGTAWLRLDLLPEAAHRFAAEHEAMNRTKSLERTRAGHVGRRFRCAGPPASLSSIVRCHERIVCSILT